MTDKINGFRPNFPQTKPNAGGTRPKSYTSSTDSPIFDNPLNNATKWYSDNIQKTGVQNAATSSLKGSKGTAIGAVLDSATTIINAGAEVKSGNIRGGYVQVAKGASGIAGGILGGAYGGQAGANAGSIAGENIGEQVASFQLDIYDAARESKSASEFADRASNSAIDRGTETARGVAHGAGEFLFGSATSRGIAYTAFQCVDPKSAAKVNNTINDMHAIYDKTVDKFYDFTNSNWRGVKGVAVAKAEKAYNRGKAAVKSTYNEGKAVVKSAYNRGKAAVRSVVNKGKTVVAKGKAVVAKGKAVVAKGKAVVAKASNMASRAVNVAKNAYNRARSWLFG